MRLGQIIKWSLLATLIFVAGGAGVLYFLASGVPDAYRPARLTAEQRQDYAFTKLLQDRDQFDDLAQQDEPYDWSIDEHRLNGYLASMDEIASIRPGGRVGEVDAVMRRAGLAEPAIDLQDGMVTLMVRSTDYDKILCADFSLEVTPEGLLSIRLVGARVGHLPIPLDQVAGMFNGLKERLAERTPPEDEEDSNGLAPSERAARLLATLIAAIDSDPVPTEFHWQDNLDVRVDGLRIGDDKLTLHVVPLRRN